MLEAELSSRDDFQIELQRTKDELRDANEELAVAQHKIEVLSSSSTSNINHKENRPPANEISKRSSRLNVQTGSHDKRLTSTGNYKVQQQKHLIDTDMKMNSSRSLRKIHGMLDQMKNLESRVASFKSSLPKPVSSSVKLSNSTTSGNQSSPPRPRSNSRISNKGDVLQDGNSHIPVSRFRNSPSMSNIKASTFEMHPDSRPMSPPQRTRSSVSNHSSHYHHHYTDLKKIPDVDEKNSLKRHESKKFGGSYQGSIGGGTRSTSLHGKTHTVDLSSFNNLSINDTPVKVRPTPTYSNDSINNYKIRPRADPVFEERNYRKPYNTEKRPGSAFNSLQSRQAIGNGRT